MNRKRKDNGVVVTTKRMKLLRSSGLMGCLNDTGVTSENYKEFFLKTNDGYNLENIEKVCKNFVESYEEEGYFLEYLLNAGSINLPKALYIICEEIQKLKSTN